MQRYDWRVSCLWFLFFKDNFLWNLIKWKVTAASWLFFSVCSVFFHQTFVNERWKLCTFSIETSVSKIISKTFLIIILNKCVPILDIFNRSFRPFKSYCTLWGQGLTVEVFLKLSNYCLIYSLIWAISTKYILPSCQQWPKL